MRLFSNGALDPQLQDAVTAVRVVSAQLPRPCVSLCLSLVHGNASDQSAVPRTPTRPACAHDTVHLFPPQVRDSKTNIGRGIAFVEFNSKSAAAAALRLKDVKLQGRPLRISFLKTPKPGSGAPPAISTFKSAGVPIR